MCGDLQNPEGQQMLTGSTTLYCYSQYKNQPKQHWAASKTKQEVLSSTALTQLIFKSLINSQKENLPTAHETPINSFWITKSLSCGSCQVRSRSIHWALCLTSLAFRGPSCVGLLYVSWGDFRCIFHVFIPFFFHSYLDTSASLSPQRSCWVLHSNVTPGQLQAEVWGPLSSFDRLGLSPPHQVLHPAVWGSALPSGSTGDLKASPKSMTTGATAKMLCV